MSCCWKSRICSATSRPRAPPSAWLRRCAKPSSTRTRTAASTSRATRPCSTTCGCGTGALSTTLSARASLCAPTLYADTDVDRYIIDGKLRQTLLAPRELDLNQLGEAQNSWINSSTTYTHGYGLVLAEASRITPTGLPELLIRDAPVQVETPSLKLTRPEIYFGEAAHEPVFAPTKQLEFNYPADTRRQDSLRRPGRLLHRLTGVAHRSRDCRGRLEYLPLRRHHAR